MRRPLLWGACGWVTGMSFAANLEIGLAVIGCLASGLGIWALCGTTRRAMTAALLFSVCALAGGGWYERYEANSYSSIPLADGTEALASLDGVIASAPETDGDRVVFDLSAEELVIEDKTIALPREKVKVYVRLKTEEEKRNVSDWRRGDRIQVEGVLKQPMEATNFGGFDYRLYLRRQHIFWTIHASSADDVQRLPAADAGWSLQRAVSMVDRVREELGSRIDALYPQPVSGFMKGLLIGVTEDLDPERYQQFSQIGLTHILAISGLHVAVYVGSVLWLLSKLPLTRETRLVAAMALVPVYVVLTGAAPSVLRAGIMAMISLYAARRGLLKDGLHILAVAAVGMLAWNPFYLFHVSFQLSFIVTAGLIIGVPLMNRRIPIRNAGLQSAVSVTLAAQLVSFPLTVYYFNSFSILSFAANLFIVPLYSFIVLPLGTVSLLLAFVLPSGAPMLAAVVRWVVEYSFAAVEQFTDFGSAALIAATPPLWWIGAYYIVLYLFFTAAKPFRAIGYGTLIAALLLYAYAPNAFDRSATVAFLDVGQGDAILIRTPHGKHLLIDAGGTLSFMKPGDEWKFRKDPFEVGKDVVVPLLKKRGVQSLDAVFLSHADTDHIGGMEAVLQQVPVRRLFFNGTVKDGDTVERVLRTAVDKRIPLNPLYSGMTVLVDPDTKLRVLYPEPMEGLRTVEKQNNVSLVFLLTIYDRTFLFSGDVTAAEERAILQRIGIDGYDIKVDVLKIAHHGSKSSTIQEWLDRWDPAAAVISVGRTNVYRHPHPTVVERLYASRIPTLRTDLHGEIQFRVSPNAYRVRTKLPK